MAGLVRAPVTVALAVCALLAGCVRFPAEHPNVWQEQPSLEPQAGPQPSVEGDSPEPPPAGEGPQQQPQQRPPPDGCQDPDPSVVATCLDPIGAIAALPDGQGALVGERFTGRVLRVQRGSAPVELARIPVDTTGGGGLTGLTLSPTYDEDELFYAYITSNGDNRVVRVAPDDRPKPVLTGIPKGSSGNSGALINDGTGALLVATGNAGDPANTANSASLGGKVLRIDGFGKPAQGNPVPTSPVVSAGLSSPTGLCGVPGSYWVTDQGGPQDALYRIPWGHPVGSPAWTWPDRPGASGCAAGSSVVVVALANAAAMFTLHPTPEGAFTGQPSKVMENTYGRFSTVHLGPDGLLWAGTANKAGGRPAPSDDRVIRIEPPTGGAAGKD